MIRVLSPGIMKGNSKQGSKMDIQNFKERAAQEYSEIDDLYIQSLGTDPLLHLENSIQ